MLSVIVMTAHQCLFEGHANQVIMPGEQGVFEVLRFHRPMLSRLVPGVLLIDDRMIAVTGGVVKVERNAVTAIVDADEAEPAAQEARHGA